MTTQNNRVKFEDVDQTNTRYNNDYSDEYTQENDEQSYPEYNNNNNNNNNDDQNYSNRSIDPNYAEQTNQEEEEEYNTNTNIRQQEEIYYFQTKIRNSGFWGKVKLRNGTRLLITGLVLFVISIVLIGVFWGFWYSHALNYPMRILAITLLVLGVLFVIIGLISNYLMLTNPDRKNILGSPFRKVTWALIASIVLLVIASYLMTLYYTYWHNFYVNTPLIVISVVFYFFGGICFIASLKQIFASWFMSNPDYAQIQKIQIQQQQAMPEKPIESDNEQVLNRLDTSEVYSETTENGKKDFRKKQLKLTPRPVVIANDYDTILET